MHLAVAALFGEPRGQERLAGFEGVPETSQDLVGDCGGPQDVENLGKVTVDQLTDVSENCASFPAHLPDAELGVHQIHADRRGIKEGLEPGVALAHHRIRLL